MVAVGALLRLVRVHGLAHVAETVDSLATLPVDKFLAAGRRRQGERRLLARHRVVLAPGLREDMVGLGRRDSGRDRVVDLVLEYGTVLELGTTVTRAFLATDVLAVDADTVGAERGLAVMAVATNSHADRAVDTLDGHVGGKLPLTRFKAEAVFGEQDMSPVFLNGAPVGDHHRNDGSGLVSFPDGCGGDGGSSSGGGRSGRQLVKERKG